MVNAAVKEKCKLLLLFQGLVDEADLKKYKNYNHYQSLSIVFNHIAHLYIYIHNRISHNIIAVHMYGILFCIPIIYLIFAQILQFTRIWSIYPDIVLTCFNHITHTLSLYIYSEDPIYSRSRRERRERREPLTGEAPAQRHASLGPSLCASSQVPDGQGCLSRFIAVVGWFHGILWKFMVI